VIVITADLAGCTVLGTDYESGSLNEASVHLRIEATSV
jgi:hypothetical protein